MGYYTTLTIDNQVVANIQNSPVEFAKKIVDACSGHYYKTGRDAFGLGVDVPFVFLQKPREFLESTVFVYKNGRLFEMNIHSSITNELKEREGEKYGELLEYLLENVSELQTLDDDNTDSLNEEVELINDTPFTFTIDSDKEIINSGEKHKVAEPDEDIVARWLKSNNIPMTVAKLKKMKPVQKQKK